MATPEQIGAFLRDYAIAVELVREFELGIEQNTEWSDPDYLKPTVLLLPPADMMPANYYDFHPDHKPKELNDSKGRCQYFRNIRDALHYCIRIGMTPDQLVREGGSKEIVDIIKQSRFPGVPSVVLGDMFNEVQAIAYFDKEVAAFWRRAINNESEGWRGTNSRSIRNEQVLVPNWLDPTVARDVFVDIHNPNGMRMYLDGIVLVCEKIFETGKIPKTDYALPSYFQNAPRLD